MRIGRWLALGLAALAAGCGGEGEEEKPEEKPIGDRLLRGAALGLPKVAGVDFVNGVLTVAVLDPRLGEVRTAGRGVDGGGTSIVGTLQTGEETIYLDGIVTQDGAFELYAEGGWTFMGFVSEEGEASGAFMLDLPSEEPGAEDPIDLEGSFALTEDPGGEAVIICGRMLGSHVGLFSMTLTPEESIVGAFVGGATGDIFGQVERPSPLEPALAVFDLDGVDAEGGGFEAQGQGSFNNPQEARDFIGEYTGPDGIGGTFQGFSDWCTQTDPPSVFAPEECPCTRPEVDLPEGGACCALEPGLACCLP